MGGVHGKNYITGTGLGKALVLEKSPEKRRLPYEGFNFLIILSVLVALCSSRHA